MPCFHPLKGYRAVGGGWTQNVRRSWFATPMKVPCGQCIGCRLERSRQWAVRCYHESQLHEDNCFITLTYDNEHLPPDRSLHHRDWQLFMKKLRKRFGSNIRFLMCGEYGTWCRHCWMHPKQCKCPQTIEGPGRPHFHAILFNHDFQEKVHWSNSNGLPLYVDAELSRLWPSGFSSVGAATFQSAAYVARYITKKVTGRAATDHYTAIHPQSGEVTTLTPEYLQASRGGRNGHGIGYEWFKEYSKDVWPDDFVVVNGKRVRPPRFYEKQLEVSDPDLLTKVKRERKLAMWAHGENQTPERLAVREKVQKARLNKLKRTLD